MSQTKNLEQKVIEHRQKDYVDFKKSIWSHAMIKHCGSIFFCKHNKCKFIDKKIIFIWFRSDHGRQMMELAWELIWFASRKKDASKIG